MTYPDNPFDQNLPDDDLSAEDAYARGASATDGDSGPGVDTGAVSGPVSRPTRKNPSTKKKSNAATPSLVLSVVRARVLLRSGLDEFSMTVR